MTLADPHHDGSSLYVPEQAPEPGDTVPVFVRIPPGSAVDAVWARVPHDADPTYAEGKVDRTTPDGTWWRCDITLRNPLTKYRFLLSGPDGGYRWLTGTGTHGHDVPDTADFTLSTAPPPPEWASDATVYQIFPDRFARSAAADSRPVPPWARPTGWDEEVVFRGDGVAEQFFGGDLDGIIEHLDHVARVGANTIYLTPFFPAASNHRYNASSFDEVDPLLGGNEALGRLAQAVHGRGWRLLGDLTTNHSGDTHEWFRTALSDPAAPERGFYYFDSPESNGYHGFLGVMTLPKFRFDSAELRRRMIDGHESVTGRWLRGPYDLDGWRVDVAHMTGRHAADDFCAGVARTMRRTVAATGKDRLLIAEHPFDASADLSGDGWHGTMNYAGFTRPVWTWLHDPTSEIPDLDAPVRMPRLPAQAAMATMRAVTSGMPWRAAATSWSLLGSHDTARIRTVVGTAEATEVAAGLLFTMPGAPMVFAGDEVGQTGVLGEDARRPFPWHEPETWDRTTLDRYAALAALRRSHDALRHGGLRWIHAEDDVLAYLRESSQERLLVLAARGPHVGLRLPARLLGLPGEAQNEYGGAPPLRADADGVIDLPGDGPTFQVWQLA